MSDSPIEKNLSSVEGLDQADEEERVERDPDDQSNREEAAVVDEDDAGADDENTAGAERTDDITELGDTGGRGDLPR